jgi:hypothetical protein
MKRHASIILLWMDKLESSICADQTEAARHAAFNKGPILTGPRKAECLLDVD